MGVPLLFFDILFNEFRKMKQMAYLLLWMIYNGFFYSLLRKFPVFKTEPGSIHNNAFTRHFSRLRQAENFEHCGSDVRQLAVPAQLAQV